MATYEIIIKNQTEDEADTNLAGAENAEDKKKKNTAKSTTQLKNAMKYVALQSTRELVVSKVGAFTRNNLLQRKIDALMGLGQIAIAFAINPALGAVTMATSLISQSIDWSIQQSKESSRLSVMGERAGYINRSRD